MPITGKRIAQISSTDILELVLRRTREDAFIEFKEVLFRADYTREKLEQEKDDFARDVVAFANAQGGHILVGIKEQDECASELKAMDSYQASQIVKIARDTAIQRVKPNVHMEVDQVAMKEDRSEWIVVAFIPESENKPHMWAYSDGMRFVIRDNNRKRTMAHDEVKGMFLRGPQEQWAVRILGELQSLRSVIEALSAKPEK
jgi:predicted HTH transcriptional regulator